MIQVSNQTRQQLLILLTEIERIQGSDNKTLNTKRKAKMMITKLKRCKQSNIPKTQTMKTTLGNSPSSGKSSAGSE